MMPASDPSTSHHFPNELQKDMRATPALPILEGLRQRIQRLEGGAARHRTVLPFGISAIDQHLPEGGLPLGALHEVAGGGNRAVDRSRRWRTSQPPAAANGQVI
jgi:hypothetical protein